MGLSIDVLCDQVSVRSINEMQVRSILNNLTQLLLEQTENNDQKLDRTVEGYYKTGLNYLRGTNSANGESRQQRIEGALTQLVSASSVENSTLVQARSMFFAGVCYSLLGDNVAALCWYERAYGMGFKHRQNLLERMENAATVNTGAAGSTMAKATKKGIGGLILGGIVVGSVLLIAKAVAVKRANDIRDQIIVFDNTFMVPLRGVLQVWPSKLAVVRQPLSIPEEKTIL